MATLYITEFRGASPSGAPRVPPLAENVLKFTGSEASPAFDANTEIVGVLSDADCHIAWGSNPVATTKNMRLPANALVYFSVRPGSDTRVAAIIA